ncbi:MAG TPA: peroxiredoxin-like family protein [Candidatus Acidoferrales bacterium]|nr:peroxiredoxin-like family protein [Candidatus Acidoferrales bacterium]
MNTNVTQTIAEQVTALKASLRAKAPADILSVFDREQEALGDAGVPAGVAALGTRMPDGNLLGIHGEATSLALARKGKAAVVVFYRGAWCPYCNLALHAYQDQLVPALAEKGIPLIAVSPQKPDGSLTMQQTNNLAFTVLSDPGNQIGVQLGILSSPRSEAARAAAEAFGVDVAAGNADGTDAVPMPTVVIVDAAGFIRWIDVHPDYSTRTEPQQILAAVASTIG